MQYLKKIINHQKLYYWSLILTAICLPLSKFALSVSMIILLANWVIEFEFKTKWQRLANNRSILVFISLFAIHIIWLINTNNFSYAFKDIGSKIILLLYPIIIGTSAKLNKKHLKIVLQWFVVAAFVSSLISVLILLDVTSIHIKDIRDISPFMSHIRLGILMNMAIFVLGYFLISKDFSKSRTEKITYSIAIIWFMFFLFLLKSLTGIIIFIIVALILAALITKMIKELVPRLFVQVFILTLVLLAASYITHSIARFYTTEKIDFNKLEKYTVNGNPYIHYKSKRLENGNYAGLFVCKEELKQEWGKRSSLDYHGKDKKGQDLRITLMRYLTSKGYRKDSVGVSKLTDQDIQNIESGMANYIFTKKFAIYPRIYQVIWEFDVYKKGGNPAGNSVTQRIEYLKTAKDIIKENFWFGVGTGDIQDAFNRQYELNNSQLPQNKRLRAHNQYVTFLLTFGIFGFIVFIISIFYPAIHLGAFKNYLFIAFILIAILSFINEDTLETQIGVTFFSYFYSLFLFGNNMMIKKE